MIEKYYNKQQERIFIMKKMNEAELYETGIAARYAFTFTILSLLVWTLNDFIRTGEPGWQFKIMMVACAIFLWTKVYFRRKAKKND